MKGYVTDIEVTTEDNDNFRKVLYTAKHSQLVVMSLKPGEEIGAEVHKQDQFLRFESGSGTVTLDGVEHEVSGSSAVVVPAGTKHNVVNTSDDEPLKLYTVYSPPHHQDGVVHATKEDAEADDEEFDGTTTE